MRIKVCIGWLIVSIVRIVYTGISEVVNDSNIGILIGALIKNQQGQNQLKPMSINIFKEMFFVF